MLVSRLLLVSAFLLAALSLGCPETKIPLHSSPKKPIVKKSLCSVVSRLLSRDLTGIIEYHLDLKFFNPNARPIWFLFPNMGGTPLKKRSSFVTEPEEKSIELNRFLAKGGNIDLFSFFGKDAFFHFIQLPPHGQVRFLKLSFRSLHPLKELEVWTVEKITVNQKRPFLQWFKLANNFAKSVVVAHDSPSKRISLKQHPLHPNQSPKTLKPLFDFFTESSAPFKTEPSQHSFRRLSFEGIHRLKIPMTLDSSSPSMSVKSGSIVR